MDALIFHWMETRMKVHVVRAFKEHGLWGRPVDHVAQGAVREAVLAAVAAHQEEFTLMISQRENN